LLNWKIRYSKIMLAIPELFDPAWSVVEVGCGPHGIAQFLDRKVIGIEPTPMTASNKHLEIIEGSIMALPFSDSSIDYVLCIDVLEHLAADLRRDAISELLRISRKKVIISCPCDVWARAGEFALKEMFQNTGVAVPEWLLEHLEFGLPSVGEILNLLIETGCVFAVEGNETMLQHFAGIALDYLYPAAQDINNRLQLKSPSQPPIGGNDWDLYYSFMFTLKKPGLQNGECSEGKPSKQQPQPQASPIKPRRARSALLNKIFGFIDPSRINPGFASKAHRGLPKYALNDKSQDDEASIRPGEAIYAVYHKKFPLSHLGSIKPIFTGDLARSFANTGLTDICSKTENLPNHRWSELSAIYKIWTEGPKTSVVGFCHYRRLFDFTHAKSCNTDGLPLARQTDVTTDDLAGGSHNLYNAETVSALHDGNKIIVAMPHDTENSIFIHYCEIHNMNDYLEIINHCAATKSPLLPSFLEQFSDHYLTANNMFILSWSLFSELCTFWFDILNAFVIKHPERQSTAYQHRDVAFLSERIFDAWIRYRTHQGNKIIALPIFYVTSAGEDL
jgi:hypothetical protein